MVVRCQRVKDNAQSSFWYNLDEIKIEHLEMKKLLRFKFFSAKLPYYQKGPRPRPLVFMIKTSVNRKDEYGA